ncbi:UNVERIFIED_CONTAM: hypothetical protein Scaly_2185800 [Sesamum calycinum]|uniref:Uncharacterized protein n=1 Tax=Sesamum calycinum TaxID=2727403 RepID=A0AAW2MQL0_9LAMI
MAANKIPTLKAAASSTNETIGVFTISTSKKAYPEDDSSSFAPRSTSCVASVMVTNTTTLEEQIGNLTRAREVLAKHVQEQDSQISKLMNKINNTDDNHVAGKQVEGQDEVETSLKQQSNERERGATIQEPHYIKEKQEAKRGANLSPNPDQRIHGSQYNPFKIREKLNDMSGEKKDTHQERRPRKLTLKEMQTKQYRFLDSNVSRIFDDLLNANHIKLPQMKKPEEVGRTNDPKYCKCH